MANFKELNENLDKVLQILLSNQDLCKLLYYDTIDALGKEDFNLEETPKLLMFKKIFPFMKDTKVLTTASSILMVGLDNFKPTKANNFVNNILYFRILCHEDLWQLQSGYRPYKIVYEIANMINDQNGIGIWKTKFYNGGEVSDGKDYKGFEITYEISEFGKNFNG